MHLKKILILHLASLFATDAAPAEYPPGAQYSAALPSTYLPINGQTVVSSAPNSSCAVLTNNFNSLPSIGGPFGKPWTTTNLDYY